MPKNKLLKGLLAALVITLFGVSAVYAGGSKITGVLAVNIDGSVSLKFTERLSLSFPRGSVIISNNYERISENAEKTYVEYLDSDGDLIRRTTVITRNEEK